MSPLRAFILVWGLMLSASSLLHAEGGFKYSYVPKFIYPNQLFPVTVIDAREKKNEPHFRFGSPEDVKLLSEKPLVIRNGNDRFYTFYFKARSHEVTIPRLIIEDESGEEIVLEPQKISMKQLKHRKDFCGVLAADMKVKRSQVSHYDETNDLVTLSIEAYEANLEDMFLPNVQEYGVEDLRRHGAKISAEFYVVIPSSQKMLKFSYFNTIKHQYVSLNVPVELLDTPVTTQSDLNPKADSFEKLKRYTFMTLTGFFLLMFLFRRDFFYLILGVVALITLLTFYIPHKKICVKQGAPLYILPTETSSISTKIAQRYTTPLLGERLKFNKIQYQNGIIGWVKDEDLCKN